MRSSFKFVIAIAVIAAFGALVAGSAGKLWNERSTGLSTTVPSDRSQLKGDLDQQSSSGHRLSSELFPAFAEDAFRSPDSGTESERLLQGSFAKRTAFVSCCLSPRPPPA